MILLKSPEEIKIMDQANTIVHNVLDYLEPHVFMGTTTRELDLKAEQCIMNQAEGEALPTFKGYMGYPASICVSINEEIVHGIPGDRTIKDGDVVSIDIGVTYKGFVGDAAKTFIVGKVSNDIKDLVANTKEALRLGVETMVPGNTLYDINQTISKTATRFKYGNIRAFCGHGIGRNMHEDPKVFNYINTSEPDFHLREGVVLALEPMFTLGTSEAKILSDGWTAITQDKSVSAHWECSVAITATGPQILGKKDLFK